MNTPQTYSPSPIIEDADVTAFRAVMRGSAEHTCKLPTAAGVACLGIVSEHSATAEGDAASVFNAGIVKAEANAAWSAGDRLNIAAATGRLKKAVSSYTSNMTNATNNDFVATAVEQGAGGSEVTLELINPGADATLAVHVSGKHVAVTLGYATGAVTTTPDLLAAAIAAEPLAAALLEITNKTGNDGSGLVEALDTVRLSGGENDFATAQEDATTQGDIRRIKLDGIK